MSKPGLGIPELTLAFVVGLMLAVTACQPAQQVASGTRVWIDAPRNGSLPFAPYRVWVTMDSKAGLQQAELSVNGVSIGALNCGDPIQSLVTCKGMWTPPSPGDYRLEARAIGSASGSGVSAPVVVTVGQITPTITPTVTRTGTVPPGVIAPIQIISVTPSVTPTRTGTVPPGIIPPIQIITVTPTATPTRTGTPPPQSQPQPPAQTGCSGTPIISSFSASPSTINAGSSTTLSWGSVSNADSVEISGIGGVATPGSRSVSPTTTTTYTLSARCGSNTVTWQATVNVSAAPTGCSGTPVISYFSASPSSISKGGSATLSWGTVSNADSIEISQGIGAVAAPGSSVVSPSTTTTYSLVARCGAKATQTARQVTVYVATPVPPPPSNPPSAPGSLTATDKCTGTGTNKTRQVTLKWSAVSGATGYKVYRGSTLIATMTGANSTSTTDKPSNYYSAYTYEVKAYNSAGNSSGRTAQAAGCID